MEFTTADPFTKLYKEVKDQEELNTAENSRYAQKQLINIAPKIIRAQVTIFEH